MVAGWSERVYGTFKTVERMVSAGNRNLKGFVVLIAADFASTHWLTSKLASANALPREKSPNGEEGKRRWFSPNCRICKEKAAFQGWQGNCQNVSRGDMAVNRGELVECLNDLIETCRDGDNGFQTAAAHV